MTKDRSEVLQGTLDLLVLKTLDGLGPLHGTASRGASSSSARTSSSSMKARSTPPLLRLVQKGWIRSGMGRVEQQPEGEVLFDYQDRPETTGPRDQELERISG